MTPDQLAATSKALVPARPLAAAAVLSPAAVRALQVLATTAPLRGDTQERWSTARWRLPGLREAGVLLADVQELAAHGLASASGSWRITAEGIAALRALGLLAPGWPRVVAKEPGHG